MKCNVRQEKPPIGLKPYLIWVSERQKEILDAVSRYIDAEKSIPIDWIIEFNHITELRKWEKY